MRKQTNNIKTKKQKQRKKVEELITKWCNISLFVKW